MTDKFQWGPGNPHPLSQMRTELVWEGRYDEYGRSREVDFAESAMPHQRIEKALDGLRTALLKRANGYSNLSFGETLARIPFTASDRFRRGLLAAKFDPQRALQLVACRCGGDPPNHVTDILHLVRSQFRRRGFDAVLLFATCCTRRCLLRHAQGNVFRFGVGTRPKREDFRSFQEPRSQRTIDRLPNRSLRQCHAVVLRKRDRNGEGRALVALPRTCKVLQEKLCRSDPYIGHETDS